MLFAFGDIEQLLPIAFAILYILGQVAGVFGKGKKDEESAPTKREPSRTVPRRGAPTKTPPRPPRAPVPPRPPQARGQRPSPPRPTPSMPTPRPVSGGSKPEPRYPAPPVPTPPTARRVEPVRPARQADMPGRTKRRLQPAAEARRRESVRPAREAERAAERKAKRVKQPSAEGQKARRPRRKDIAGELRSVLMRPSGFRAAFLLSELLAPPVALREDHLVERR